MRLSFPSDPAAACSRLFRSLVTSVLFSVVLAGATEALFAHPGRADRHGGHRCWRSCGDWGLEPEEYHLHDDRGNPVRLGTRKRPDIRLPQAGSAPQTPEAPAPPEEPRREEPAPPTPPAAPEPVAAPAPHSSCDLASQPLPLLLALLALLFSWLLLLRSRGKRRRR
ncbi:MAG: hypothetical protein AB1805_07730 [Nitrospirota bacterium]